MSKFCKILENDKGDQLLVIAKPSDTEDKTDIMVVFQADGGHIEITIGESSVPSNEALDVIGQDFADDVLNDPEGWLINLMG